jgi:hypothetical protein
MLTVEEMKNQAKLPEQDESASKGAGNLLGKMAAEKNRRWDGSPRSRRARAA